MKVTKSISQAIVFLFLAHPAWCADLSREYINSELLHLLKVAPLTKRININLGRDSKIKSAIVDVTGHGNGSISLGNITLHLLDVDDDGLIYKDSVLGIDAVDLNGDGFLDIVVTGVIIHTGEKESDPRTEESLAFIYIQNSDGRTFREAYRKSSISIAKMK